MSPEGIWSITGCLGSPALPYTRHTQGPCAHQILSKSLQKCLPPTHPPQMTVNMTSCLMADADEKMA
jgi:hypothetical protein